MYKIRERKDFINDPDEFLKNITLPVGVKVSKQVLVDNLWVKIEKNQKKGKKLTTKCVYYYGDTRDIRKKIADVSEMDFYEAKRQSTLIAKTFEQHVPAAKNTLQRAFDEYMAFSSPALSANTIKKKTNIFRNKFSKIANKELPNLKLKDFLAVMDEYYKAQKYAMVSDIYELSVMICEFAQVRGWLKRSPFFGVRNLKSLYSIPRTLGYGYIHTDADLRLLVKYCSEYSGQIGLRNALVFGLCTALRAGNIRTLERKHLRKDENGYYLSFASDETKMQRAECLGLPEKIGKWLESIDTDGLFFKNTAGNGFSDACFSKALRNYHALDSTGRVVFHSIRSIFKTFAAENVHQNPILGYGSERVMFHALTGVEGRYNRAKNIETTRLTLEWWLTYLENLGLKL